MKFRRYQNLLIRRLTDDYFVGFNPFSNKGVVVFSNESKKLIDFVKEAKSYDEIKKQFRTLGGGELNEILDYLTSFAILVKNERETKITFNRPNLMNVWLSLTNECNLRCRYCFVKKGKEEMNWRTAKRSLETILFTIKKHGTEEINIKFGGGEPTLRPRFIEEIVDYFNQIRKGTGTKVNWLLVTNGVNIPERLINFIKASQNFRISISLDGVGKWNDKQRIMANGDGSFKFIDQTINVLLKKGIKPRISTVVSNENCLGLNELIKYVLERDLPYRLRFYTENMLSCRDKELKLSGKKVLNGILSAYKEVENYYRERSRSKNKLKPKYLGYLTDEIFFQFPTRHGCGAGSKFFGIDWQGIISPCPQFSEPAIGDIFQTNDLVAASSAYRYKPDAFKNIDVDLKLECSGCLWKFWCAGGCPGLAYRSYGEYNTKSPYCGIYKKIIPEFLKLEGYRILSDSKLL